MSVSGDFSQVADEGRGGSEFECFARPVVELGSNGQMKVPTVRNGGLLRVLFPEQPNGVFDSSFLPGVVGMAEESTGSRGGLDPLVVGEWRSVVVGDGVDDEVLQQVSDRGRDGVRGGLVLEAFLGRGRGRTAA